MKRSSLDLLRQAGFREIDGFKMLVRQFQGEIYARTMRTVQFLRKTIWRAVASRNSGDL